MVVLATVTIDEVISFTDSGQEFRLDCILNFNGTASSGGESVSGIFARDDIKAKTAPKSGTGILSNGDYIYYDPSAQKIYLFSSGSTISTTAHENRKGHATFWFKKQ